MTEKFFRLNIFEKLVRDMFPMFGFAKCGGFVRHEHVRERYASLLPERFRGTLVEDERGLGILHDPDAYTIDFIHLDDVVVDRELVLNLPLNQLLPLGYGAKIAADQPLTRTTHIRTPNGDFIGCLVSHACADGYSSYLWGKRLFEEMAIEREPPSESVAPVHRPPPESDPLLESYYYSKTMVSPQTLADIDELHQSAPDVSRFSLSIVVVLRKLIPYYTSPDQSTLIFATPIDLRRFNMGIERRTFGNFCTQSHLRIDRDELLEGDLVEVARAHQMSVFQVVGGLKRDDLTLDDDGVIVSMKPLKGQLAEIPDDDILISAAKLDPRAHCAPYPPRSIMVDFTADHTQGIRVQLTSDHPLSEELRRI